MDIEFIREFIEVFIFFAIVLGGAYVLVVKLGAKVTGREKKDLIKLLLAAIVGIILMMLFASSIA